MTKNSIVVNTKYGKHDFNPETAEVTVNDIYVKRYMMLPICGNLIIFTIKEGEMKGCRVFGPTDPLNVAYTSAVFEKMLEE